MATSPTDENLEKQQHIVVSPIFPETAETSPPLHSGILLSTTSDNNDNDSDLSTTSSVELDNTRTPHSTTQVRQLFVGNLPFRVRWQDLKDLFRKAGKVVRADVALSFDNRSKGHGTVLFATIEDAQAAIDMLHNCKWHGRTLEVREDRGYFEQPFMKKSSSSSSSSSLSSSSLPKARRPHSHQRHHHHHHQNHQHHQKQTLSTNRDNQQQGFIKQGLNSQSLNMTQPGRQLFVGNLPFHCQWQDVKDLFRGAGKIIRADVAQEPGGKSRGFGTVLYTTLEDAENAIAMFDGYEYQGRQLRVHFDKFASGQFHQHHQQQQQQQQQQQPQQQHQRQGQGYLHPPLSRFGNLEFGQVTDPGVLENLKQTYGNGSTGGYAAFMMGQSPYLSTSIEQIYSPPTSEDVMAQNQNGYYLEPVSSGFSPASQQQQQQQQSIYPQQRSNYNMAPPCFGYYPTSTPSLPSQSTNYGSYDQEVIQQQQQQNVSSFGIDHGLIESDMTSKQSSSTSSSFFMYEQTPAFMSPPSHQQWPRSPQEKQEVQQQQQNQPPPPLNLYLPSFHQQQSSSSNLNHHQQYQKQQDEVYDFYSYTNTHNHNDGISGSRGGGSNDYNANTTTTGNLNEEMRKMGLSDNNNMKNGSAGLANRGDAAARNDFGLHGQNNGGGKSGGAWDPLNGLKI